MKRPTIFSEALHRQSPRRVHTPSHVWVGEIVGSANPNTPAARWQTGAVDAGERSVRGCLGILLGRRHLTVLAHSFC